MALWEFTDTYEIENEGIKKVTETFSNGDTHTLWEKLNGERSHTKKAKSTELLNPVIRTMHWHIEYTICATGRSTGAVIQDEMLLLSDMLEGRKVNSAALLA